MTSTKRKVLCVALTSVLARTAYGQAVNRIIYVDANSNCVPADCCVSSDCSSPCTDCEPCACSWKTTCGCSWDTAFKYLQDALQFASDNSDTIPPNSWNEIWVARGVYEPNNCTNPTSNVCTHACDGGGVGTEVRFISFCMQNKLRIYGGFYGWESRLADRPLDPDPFTIDPSTDSILYGDRYVSDQILTEGECKTYSPFNFYGDPTNTWTSIGTPDPETGLCPITFFNPAGLCYECRDAYGLLVTRWDDNSESVVSGPSNLSGRMGDGSAAILDGFSITGGFAQGWPGDDPPEPGGGGMRFLGGSPKVWNCTIKGNRANNGGGAIYVYGMEVFAGHFVNCVIMENYSGHGGGMGGKQQNNSPWFVNCYVLGNASGDHGAAFSFTDNGGLRSEPKIINCVIAGNKSGPRPGGPGGTSGSGGAIYVKGVYTVTITNSVIAHNSALGGGVYWASHGGGLYIDYAYETWAKADINNTIIWGNLADHERQMHVGGSANYVHVRYSNVERFNVESNVNLDIGGDGCNLTNTTCFVGACADDHSVECVTNAVCTGHNPPLGLCTYQVNLGNVAAHDPKFVNPGWDPNGPDYTPVNDYLLMKESPCIDAGDNRLVPLDKVDLNQDGDLTEKIPLDLGRSIRFINYPENAQDRGQPDTNYPLITDMGAYEFEGCMTSADCAGQVATCKGTPVCTGTATGNVCGTLRDDCNVDTVIDACMADNPTSAVVPDVVNKCRFISFSVPYVGSAAIKVRLNLLHHPNPPYEGVTGTSFAALEGQDRWVGPPVQYFESASSAVTFRASKLQCTPHYQVWGTETLHVTGGAIVPSSEYMVEVKPQDGTACSPWVALRTTRWGDVETPYNPPAAAQQPDTSDISALVNKFKSALGAPIKARVLLAGQDDVDLSSDLSFHEISACVDAFKGMPYPSGNNIAGCP